jgi:hypothetical protein
MEDPGQKVARVRFETAQENAIIIGHSLNAWERLTFTYNEVFVSKCQKCGHTAIIRLGKVPQNKLTWDMPPVCDSSITPVERTYYEGMIL